MDLRAGFAILAGKCSARVLRLLGKGGTSLPGRIVTKLCPDILGRLAKNMKIIAVTGTNGKTTTCHIIRDILQESGYSLFCNDSGANLLQGVVSSFVEAASLGGKIPCEVALLECDEAAMQSIVKHFGNLDVTVVVTNIFRDQLDRYGEVLVTVNKIKEALQYIPQAKLCLNADCSLTTSLKDMPNGGVTFFGVDKPLYESSSTDISDAVYCLHCKTKYQYKYRTFGHLGGFYCDHCGYRRQDSDVSIDRVISWEDVGATVALQIHGKEYEARVSLPGGYNLYNALAALTAGVVMEIPEETMMPVLGRLTTHFGRMEQVALGDSVLHLVLVKNPAGFNEVIQYLMQRKPAGNIVFGLNDNYADGKDVSWIYDVEFERMLSCVGAVKNFYFTGIRAYDMQVRLKYAGFPTEKFLVEKDYKTLIGSLQPQGCENYLVLSYTSMLAFRDALSEFVHLDKYKA